MSLSDRLAAAAKERGELGARRAAPTALRSPEPKTDRVQVVLAASRPTTAVTPDPAAAPDAVCPTCGRTGELAVVDLPRRTADWGCEHCGCMWRVTLPAPADGELLPPSH